MKKYLTKKRLIILLIIGFVVAGGYFMSKNRPEAQVTEVEITTVRVQKSISSSGVVIADPQTNLSFPGAGRLTALYAEEGDFVSQGQLLASIYNAPDYHSIQAAKDARDIALRDRDLFIQQYADDTDLVGGDEEYNINLRRLNEFVSRAEATYNAQQAGIANTYMYAPFSGIVVSRPYQQGETATPGSPIFILADTSNLMFEINIDQEDFGALSTDQEVRITLDSYEDVTFSGKIDRLPLSTNPQTQDFVVKITLNDTNDQKILVGMTGNADIILDETKNETQAVFFDTIFSDTEGDYVWIVENGSLKKVYVDIGIQGDLYTEVKSPDLREFTIVIPSDPGAEMSEGMKVLIN